MNLRGERRRILVTGGAGFIGERLVRLLARNGHRVVVFDRRDPGDVPGEYVRGDVRDFSALESAMTSADTVVHLAAVHRDDVRPVSLYRDVNVEGTENVARAARERDVQTIVFTSTAAVYGLNVPHPDETTTPDPFNEYGESKLAAERVLRAWGEEAEDRSLVLVRPCVVFGEENTGNVANLIHQIAGRRFALVGKGRNRKSMAYVGNLAHFIVWSLEHRLPFTVVNYADKPDLTMKELVTLIRRELGVEDRTMVRLPYWLGLLGGWVFDGLSALTGTNYPFSSVRVRKFCSETVIPTDRLESTEFQRPYSLGDGLRRMIKSMDTSGSPVGHASVKPPTN